MGENGFQGDGWKVTRNKLKSLKNPKKLSRAKKLMLNKKKKNCITFKNKKKKIIISIIIN